MNSIVPVAQPISTPLQSEPISLISNSSIWETASSTAFWAFERTVSSFVDIVKGPAIYSIFLGAITQGQSFKFFYNLIFNRKAFQYDTFLLPLNERQTLHVVEAQKFASENLNHEDLSNGNFNLDSIKNSQNPQSEFYKQLAKVNIRRTLFPGQEINARMYYYSYNFFKSIHEILITPILEEILFRGLMQDLILKKLGTYILNTTVPQYVSQEEDSIWYSIGRISLTSYLFSYIHEWNRAELGDDLTNKQRKVTLILGFVCGCIKDYFGLSSAIGAHIFNNLYTTTVIFFLSRDRRVD